MVGERRGTATARTGQLIIVGRLLVSVLITQLTFWPARAPPHDVIVSSIVIEKQNM